MNMTSKTNVIFKIGLISTLLSFVFLFFTSTVSADNALSGWISPRFEYVDNNLPTECDPSKLSGIEIELVDYSGNPVSSNGAWKVYISGSVVQNIPANNNKSGVFCLNPSMSSIQIKVAGNSSYREFSSPVIEPDDSNSGSSLSDLKGKHFKGYVQLTEVSDSPTVIASGIDTTDIFIPGTSKFIITSGGFSTAQNNDISASQISKTIIAIQNSGDSGITFDKAFSFNYPAGQGSNQFNISADKFSGAGDGVFYWIGLQNLNGKIVNDALDKRLTFKDNPFSSISERNSFQFDFTKPQVGIYSIAPNPAGNKTPGVYDLLLGAEFIDNLSLKTVSIKMIDKNTGVVVDSCEQSFLATDSKSFRWGANNSNHCVFNGVLPGNYVVKYFAEDKFGNINEIEQDFSITPDMDIPEMGLGNLEKLPPFNGQLKDQKPSYEKVTWSTYNIYGHVKDLNGAPITNNVGSNDPTSHLGFCFSVVNLADEDFRQGKPGVRCENNGGFSNVPLTASMPFNFARKPGVGNYLNSVINFATLTIGGKSILSTTSPTTTIYFRSYGTNIMGTGYSPIEEISVYSSIKYDPDVTPPIVEAYFGNIGTDKAWVGVDIKSLGGVPKFTDWGVCITKDENDANELKNNIETIINHNNTFTGNSAAGKKFYYLPGGRAAGGMAISDNGYLYPNCRLDDNGSNNGSSDELNNWGSGERGGYPIKAAHVFLGFGSTQLANPQIVDPLLPNTTYYALAFAKNEIGIGFGDIKSFTTTGLKFAFDYWSSNKPKIELDNDSYDPDTGVYGEATLYFFVADKSTAATPVTGRDISYKIEVTDNNGDINYVIPKFSSQSYTKAFYDEVYSYNIYHNPAFSNRLTTVKLKDIPLGSYRIKITLNHDGYYTNLIDSLHNPVFIISSFEVKKPLSLGDTTTSGSSGSEDLNIDPNLSLSAEPNLVRAGQSTKIKWKMDNVGPKMSCTVSGPSTFGTNGKETFNHVQDPSKGKTDPITGEFDSGAVNNTQLYTFSCVNTVQTYTATARVSVIGTQQEI